MNLYKAVTLATLLLTLSACATNIPEAIRAEPPDNPGLAQVHDHANQFEGKQVRWGGTIANVEPLENETRVEIVERSLNSAGQPIESDQSAGRFIARIPQFIEPETYTKGRKLTIIGTIETQISGQIGEHPYDFPVVRVDSHYLWPKAMPYRNSSFYYDPFYDDPFGNPFYYRRGLYF